MAGRILVIVLAVVASACGLSLIHEQWSLKVVEDIKAQGFPAELHHVTTKDGYILGMHRISHGRNDSPGKRPIVFLMHAILSASSSFLVLGPEYAIAYNLADAGFDVWMGNHRGNIYSRRHISLNPDDPQQKMDFFDFSWEEGGLVDLPAMVDYALKHTGQEKLHYVGHSQGGTNFLVLASMEPEFSNKFASAHLLAGGGNMAHFPFAPLKAIAQRSDVIYSLGRSTGNVEIPSFDAVPFSKQKIVENRFVDYYAGDEQCRAFGEMIGINYLLVNRSFNIPVLGGASLKQIVHYGQDIKDKSFKRFDHGVLSNLMVYGSRTPPSYDLSKITVKVTMHYSAADILVAETDVLDMAAVMPNTKVRKVARETFGHVSYLFSPDVKELVTDYIIEKLKETPV